MNSETEQILTIEIIDIEVYAREGRPVPHGHHYRYRVNKQSFVTESPLITCEEILERAGLTPTDRFRLRQKLRHGPPQEVKPGTVIDLRAPGIERFIAQAKEVQDGLEERHEFALAAADTAFLDSLGRPWETLRVAQPNSPPRLWILIYGVTLPDGYQVATADIAIELAPGYPTSQLDMAYFHPPLVLRSGAAINCLSVEVADGKDWQRWSRHRTGGAPWIPGVDDLESHFAYVLDWLLREVEK